MPNHVIYSLLMIAFDYFSWTFLNHQFKIDTVFQVDKPDNKVKELNLENILSFHLRNNFFVDF